MNMTMREAAWRIEALNKRRREDLKLQASLHGAELKGEPAKDKEPTVDDKAQAVFDKLLEGGMNGKKRN